MIDYKEKIAEYGNSLPTEIEKENARDIFGQMYDKGYNLEFIYFAIQNLKGKRLIENNGLFFYKTFQNQVYYLIEQEHKKQEEIARIQEHNARVLSKPRTEKKVIMLAPKKPRDKGYIDLDSITDDDE